MKISRPRQRASSSYAKAVVGFFVVAAALLSAGHSDASTTIYVYGDSTCTEVQALPSALCPDLATLDSVHGIEFFRYVPGATDPGYEDIQYVYTNGIMALHGGTQAAVEAKLDALSTMLAEDQDNVYGAPQSDIALLYDVSRYTNAFPYPYGDSYYSSNGGGNMHFVGGTGPANYNHIDIVITTPAEATTLKSVSCMGVVNPVYGDEYFSIQNFPSDAGEPSFNKRNGVVIRSLPESASDVGYSVLMHELGHLFDLGVGRPKSSVHWEFAAEFGRSMVKLPFSDISGGHEYPYHSSYDYAVELNDDLGSAVRFQGQVWLNYLAEQGLMGTPTDVLDDFYKEYFAPVDGRLPYLDFLGLSQTLTATMFDDADVFPTFQNEDGSAKTGEERAEQLFQDFAIALIANDPSVKAGQWSFPLYYEPTDALPVFQDNGGTPNTGSVPPEFTVDNTSNYQQVVVKSGTITLPSDGSPLTLQMFPWSMEVLDFDIAADAAGTGAPRVLQVRITGDAPLGEDSTSPFSPGAPYQQTLSAAVVFFGDTGGDEFYDAREDVMGVEIVPVDLSGSVPTVEVNVPVYSGVRKAVVALTMGERNMVSAGRWDPSRWQPWPYRFEYELNDASVLLDADISLLDVSGTAGLQNSTKAYAATFKDYVAGDPGFSVSFDTGATKHYRRYGFFTGIPQHSNEAIGQGFSNTTSERGMSVADYDGDSDLDIFVAHEVSPRLYEKRTGTPPYVDVAGSVAVDGTTFYLATLDSWSGAWGDYDGDGHSDLYITRADAPSTGNRHTYLSIDGQGAKDVLLHNRGYAGVGFDDVTATSGVYDVVSETISASWADVDNDRDLDLFVCWLGGLESGMTLGWSPLYVNNGDGTFTDQSFVAGSAGSSPSPEFPRLGYVNAVAWPDMNNDGYVDIALARENDTGTGNTQNVLVCINKGDADPGSLIDEPAGRPNSTEPMSDLRVADLDNNTVADLIYSPTGSATEHVYMGYASEAGTVWIEQAGTLGLTGTPGGTLLAADLNDDGDTDLFLGDSYWKTKAADGSETNGNNYLKVGLQNNSRLGGTWNSGNAFEGVGARVLLECPATGVLPALTKTFMVDGGSGRGGQEDRLLTIGLGTRDSGTLTVFWPDGATTVREFTNADINNVSSPIDLADVHAPGLVGSTVTGYTQPNPDGTMNWVFEWKTDHTIDESLDKIVVRAKAGKFGVPPLCQMTETTLRPTTYKVDHTVVASGTRLLHKMAWEDQNCNAPCTYTFDVYSTFNGDVDSKLVTQLSVPVCVQQQ